MDALRCALPAERNKQHEVAVLRRAYTRPDGGLRTAKGSVILSSGVVNR
jgi:hypothetical protein